MNLIPLSPIISHWPFPNAPSQLLQHNNFPSTNSFSYRIPSVHPFPPEVGASNVVSIPTCRRKEKGKNCFGGGKNTNGGAMWSPLFDMTQPQKLSVKIDFIYPFHFPPHKLINLIKTTLFSNARIPVRPPPPGGIFISPRRTTFPWRWGAGSGLICTILVV